MRYYSPVKHGKQLLTGLAILFSGIVSSTANSADITDQDVTRSFDERRWKVIVSPYVWAASLNGNSSLAGHHSKIDVPFFDTLKHLDFSLMGNIEITNGLIGAYFDGQYTKTSQKEHLSSDALDLDITSQIYSGGVFFRAIETPLQGQTIFGAQQTFAIEPTFGLRWSQTEATLTSGALSESRKASWTDPFIGARLQSDFNERWNLSAEADIGGFGTGTKLSANGQVYLGYRTFVFNQPTMMRIGYRALYQDYKQRDLDHQDFKWNTTQHGLVSGMSIQF